MEKFERKFDWASRLNAYLVAAQRSITSDEDVVCGENDCCTFGAGAIEAMTGTDPMAFARDRYKTKIGALRLIKNQGHDTLAGLLSDVFGEPLPPAMGRQGDVGVIGMACGIVTGRKTYFLGIDGIKIVNTCELECIFRV